jgi:membrane-associated HD superfamily phosphohydrolase
MSTRRNIELPNGIIIEQDKRSRRYIIWSNIVYLIIVFVVITYIILLNKNSKKNPKNYLYRYRNETYFLIILIIYTIITMLNSMYYHDCGGSLNKVNYICPLFEGKGYDFKIVAKNDYLFSGFTMLLTIFLLVRKFNGSTFKFFVAFIANIYMISILSFTKLDNNFVYANLIFGLSIFICFYYMIKELFNSTDNKKMYRIMITILIFFSIAASFGPFFTKKHNKYIFEIAEKANNGQPLSDNDTKLLKEKIRKDNVLHGTWHIMGAITAFLIILYKIFDINNFLL